MHHNDPGDVAQASNIDGAVTSLSNAEQVRDRMQCDRQLDVRQNMTDLPSHS